MSSTNSASKCPTRTTSPSATVRGSSFSFEPSSEPSEAAGEEYELTIAKSATLGDFLAGEDDKTLYTFSPDTAPNKSTCNGGCATAWPPFLIEGDEVTWRPAVDLNKIILGAQVVAVVALLTIRAIVKVRSKA